MTAQDEAHAEYTVVNGIIRNSGKFEGEPEYAPYFSECAGDGEELACMEEGCGEYAALVEITATDCAEFPDNFDLAAAKYVLVTENDQGFVSVSLVKDEAMADKIRAEYTLEDEEDEEGED